MMCILYIAGIILLIWAGAAIADRTLCKKRNQKSEVFMNNFFVRFLLVAFFEMVLCAMINVTS